MRDAMSSWPITKKISEVHTDQIQFLRAARIREMKDLAKDRGRDVKDGEIQTACQQACPADAITFGNVMDKNSKIRRKYTQLPELNFQPAITYLKKVNHNNRKA